MRTPLLLLVVLLHSGPSWLASGATSLPRAVIHIGPHKTSTTYIQASRVLTQPNLKTCKCWYRMLYVPQGTVALEVDDTQAIR